MTFNFQSLSVNDNANDADLNQDGDRLQQALPYRLRPRGSSTFLKKITPRFFLQGKDKATMDTIYQKLIL